MPLPKSFKKKEDIPSGFEELYEEKDGEWKLKVVEPDDNKELKDALKKERDGREKAEKEAKEAQKKLDAEETKRKAAESGITDVKLKEIEDKVRADLEKEFGPHKTEAEKLAGENRTLKLDTKIKALMAEKKVGVRQERFDTLWKLIADRFDLTADGTPMVKAHPAVKPEDYLADAVKKEFGEFYIGSQASGGGAAGVGGGGTVATGITFESLTANPAQAMQDARAAGVKE